MKPLGDGQSPVITVRLPAHLHDALKATAGPRRGDLSRWIRSTLERELARASNPGQSLSGAHQHHKEG
jgi:hypothetical protein